MIEDMKYRRGSLCQVYGHRWHQTYVIGQFVCSTCQEKAYCRGCMLTVPKGVTVITCNQHGERKVQL